MALRNAFGALGLDSTLQAIRDRLPSSIGQKAKSDSLSVTVASDQEALRVDGSAVIQPVTLAPTAADNSMSTFRLISGASTNATNVKASGGKVYKLTAFNNGSSHAYLKMYNLATTP